MRGIRLAPALVVALSLLPSPARAEDPFADFRIPEHRWFSSLVSGQVNLGSTISDGTTRASHSGNRQGNAITAFDWHAESDAAQRFAGVLLRSDWSAAYVRDEFGAGVSNRSHGDLENQRVDLDWVERRFATGTDLGAELDARASYAYHRTASSNYSRTIGGIPFDDERDSQQSEVADYLGHGQLSAGIGLGRVRDVTGVYDALLLAQRLRETGRLQHEPSPAALRLLAELFYAEPGMAAAHERPDRYFWREVERVLREDGALADGSLDAYSLERALEPVTNAGAFNRAAGARVSVMLVGDMDRGHSDQHNSFENVLLSGGVIVSSSSVDFGLRRNLDRRALQTGARWEYQHPAGMRWQTGWNVEALYGDGPSRAIVLATTASAQGVVADRWYAELSLAQQAVSRRVGGSRAEPDWFVGAIATLGYRIEDAWSVDLSALGQQEGFHGTAPGPFLAATGYLRTASVQVGLRYRPMGRFAVPGLGIAERLTPTAR